MSATRAWERLRHCTRRFYKRRGREFSVKISDKGDGEALRFIVDDVESKQVGYARFCEFHDRWAAGDKTASSYKNRSGAGTPAAVMGFMIPVLKWLESDTDGRE